MQEISQFAESIKKHEDQLFGIRLFYEGMVHIYGYDKDLLNWMSYHYNNIKARGQKNIADAKKLSPTPI